MNMIMIERHQSDIGLVSVLSVSLSRSWSCGSMLVLLFQSVYMLITDYFIACLNKNGYVLFIWGRGGRGQGEEGCKQLAARNS